MAHKEGGGGERVNDEQASAIHHCLRQSWELELEVLGEWIA